MDTTERLSLTELIDCCKTNEPKFSGLKESTSYLTVWVGHKFMSSLALWFWLVIFPEAAVRVSSGAAVSGATFKLNQRAVGKRPQSLPTLSQGLQEHVFSNVEQDREPQMKTAIFVSPDLRSDTSAVFHHHPNQLR